MKHTIHYHFQAKVGNDDEALDLVYRLRRRALDLPFSVIGDLTDYRGDQADADRVARDYPRRWLLLAARRTIVRSQRFYRVAPKRVIVFVTLPGDGSGLASFGLCLYPKTIRIEEKGQFIPVRTRLTDWSWRSSCQTQDTFKPLRGCENFLRRHLAVVSVLDHAAQLGILKEINDDSGYWANRDVEALITKVDSRNTMNAGWASRLQDTFGPSILNGMPNLHHERRAKTKGRQRKELTSKT